MKKLRKILLSLLLIFTLLPLSVLAKEGDTLVTLGEDLTPREKEAMLEELDAPEDAEIVTVSNQEEYQYLGDVLPAKNIGNKAISCAIVTYTEEGSGIHVELSPVVKVIKEGAYRNALTTAGITDADIYVTAPGNVSGSAALTGLLKTYEKKTGKKIPEEVKKVANEEMVVTSDLQNQVGEDKATDFMNEAKAQMAEKMPKNEAEVREIITNVENQYNINLTDNQRTQIVNLFNNMQSANIDWDKVKEEAGKYTDKAKEYINSEEGQKNVKKAKGLIQRFIDWIFSLLEK